MIQRQSQLINSFWTRLLILIILASTCQSFTPVPFLSQNRGQSQVQRLRHKLWAQQSLPNIDSMKATELRKELESYGISTKSFFEKTELVEALKKARVEGRTSTTPSSSSSAGSSSSTSSSSTSSREKQLQAEIAKCQGMKIGELKKELESLGMSTTTFFEKSEFVRALAEARVDGVSRKTVDGNKGTSGGKKRSEEVYDPTYRDVVMQKLNIDPRDVRLGSVIDVRLAK
jgi:hypothetical protein